MKARPVAAQCAICERPVRHWRRPFVETDTGKRVHFVCYLNATAGALFVPGGFVVRREPR